MSDTPTLPSAPARLAEALPPDLPKFADVPWYYDVERDWFEFRGELRLGKISAAFMLNRYAHERDSLASRLATAEQGNLDRDNAFTKRLCELTLSHAKALATSEATAARLREQVADLAPLARLGLWALDDLDKVDGIDYGIAFALMTILNRKYKRTPKQERAARALLSPVLAPPEPPRETPHGEAR